MTSKSDSNVNIIEASPDEVLSDYHFQEQTLVNESLAAQSASVAAQLARFLQISANFTTLELSHSTLFTLPKSHNLVTTFKSQN